MNPMDQCLRRFRHGETILPPGGVLWSGKSIESLAYQLARLLDGTRPSEDFGLWLIEDCMHKAVKLFLAQSTPIARRSDLPTKRLRRKSKAHKK